MKALMAESCCIWTHSETGRVLVITGEGCNELSIPGWNRLVMNDDKTAMIIDKDTEGE